MSETIKVTPAKGVVVHNPDRGFAVLPAGGADVPRSPYWMRRISDGDVVAQTQNATAPKKGAKPEAD